MTPWERISVAIACVVADTKRSVVYTAYHAVYPKQGDKPRRIMPLIELDPRAARRPPPLGPPEGDRD